LNTGLQVHRLNQGVQQKGNVNNL